MNLKFSQSFAHTFYTLEMRVQIFPNKTQMSKNDYLNRLKMMSLVVKKFRNCLDFFLCGRNL